MPSWLTPLVPVLSALVGMAAGLTAPAVTGGISRRSTRRNEQRAKCDEILSMFIDVNVVQALQDPQSGMRRRLLLLSARLRDDKARSACSALVQYASRDDATPEGILQAWTEMVDMVARVHRSSS